MIAYQNERMGTWTTWWNRMHKHNGENKNRNSIAHSKANAKHSRVACERNERLYPGLLLCFAHKDVLIIRERDYGYWTGLGTDSEQTSKHCKLPMLHSTATGSVCVCIATPMWMQATLSTFKGCALGNPFQSIQARIRTELMSKQSAGEFNFKLLLEDEWLILVFDSTLHTISAPYRPGRLEGRRAHLAVPLDSSTVFAQKCLRIDRQRKECKPTGIRILERLATNN